MMSDIRIIDTGYLTSAATGTQAPMANSGVSLVLKTVDFTWDRKVNYDDTPIINNNVGPTISKGSVEAPKFIISGIVNKNDAVSMSKLNELDYMCTTYGIKVLYYEDANDSRVSMNHFGYANRLDVHSGLFHDYLPHLHVVLGNFQCKDSADGSMLKFSFEGVVTQ